MKQRAYCDVRPSMAKNVLLVRNKVGHQTPSTRDLPDIEFRYGIKSKPGEGVKEMFANWEKLEKAGYASSGNSEFKPREDFVATNKSAVRHGCRTAKEFREWQLKHPIMEKPENMDSGIESREAFSKRVKGMVHGIATPVTSEMKDCLTYKYCRDAKARALAKRERDAKMRKELGIKLSKQATMARASRPTRASRGHTYIAYKPPKTAETFKMQRFLDIDKCAIVDHW